MIGSELGSEHVGDSEVRGLISIVVSLAALIVSAFTAYSTVVPRTDIRVNYVPGDIWFDQIGTSGAMITSFEEPWTIIVSNQGNEPFTVYDHRYYIENNKQTNADEQCYRTDQVVNDSRILNNIEDENRSINAVGIMVLDYQSETLEPGTVKITEAIVENDSRKRYNPFRLATFLKHSIGENLRGAPSIFYACLVSTVILANGEVVFIDSPIGPVSFEVDDASVSLDLSSEVNVFRLQSGGIIRASQHVSHSTAGLQSEF